MDKKGWHRLAIEYTSTLQKIISCLCMYKIMKSKGWL